MTKIKTNRNNTNKVPPLRFPEFSGEWKEHKLCNVCKLLSGGTPALDISCYWNGNIPFISATAMHKLYIVDSEQYLSEEGLVHGSKLLKQGNLLLLVRGSMLWKRIPVCYNKVDVAFNQDVKGIIPNNITDSSFLLYWFLSQENHIKYMVTGTGIGAGKLDMEDLLSMKILIPPQDEQRKVVSLLQLMDKRIAAQNKIIEDLEQLKSALTNQLYSGQLRFHEFADDWGVSTFGHLTEHFSHRNRDSKHYPEFSVTKDTGFIPQEEQFESREIAGDDISSYKIIRQGEFAYNPARINVGSIARYDNEVPCLISSLYVCIKPAADIDSDWLLYLLKSKRAIFYYNLYGEGGVRIYLFYPNFSRIKVKVPSIQEQHKIAALLKYIADKILQERKLKDLYMAQKQFLLQRMFI